MKKQRTIKSRISFEGIGLHTGQKVKMSLIPAPENTGILFFREDKSVLIKADVYSLLQSNKFPRRTSLGKDDVYVHTVEHLMAALAVLGIDNIQINIDAEEVPGMDGSALEFVEGIRKAGILDQSADKPVTVIKEPLWVDEERSTIVILPYNGFKITYALDYDSPFIPTEFIEINLEVKNDVDKLVKSRTFCLDSEVDPLTNMGLGKGANYTNTLIVSEKGILHNKLRVEDEFIRHKVLDLIGDLYLGGFVKGHVIALRSGHSLNIKLLSKIKAYKEKYLSAGVGVVNSIASVGSELNIEEIMKILPHRYPFLLIDKIISLEHGKKAVGIKNVTINDYFFQGHFPGRPIMPGVLIIEALAQVGGVMMLSPAENRGKLAFFMAGDNIKFRKTVEPGDQLLLEVVVGKIRAKTGQVFGKAMVAGRVVVEGNLMFALVDR